MINWTQVVVGICSIVITGVLLPLLKTKIKIARAELTEAQRKTVDYWVEVGVRWAKQWLQSEAGQHKKKEVLEFTRKKLNELGITITDEELDKIVESVYEQVKAEATKEKAALQTSQ